jgi:hypothetical protein
VLALAACMEAHPELAEIELNPVFAYPEGAVAVDVRGFLAPRRAEPSRRISPIRTQAVPYLPS